MKYGVLEGASIWVPKEPEIKTGLFGIQFKNEPSWHDGKSEFHWYFNTVEKKTRMSNGLINNLNQLDELGWRVISADGNEWFLLGKEDD